MSSKIHNCRYVMVFVQLVSAIWILGLSADIWRLEDKHKEGKDYHLIETSLTVSSFVVAGAAVVLTVTTFLACKGKDVRDKAKEVKGKAVEDY